MSNLEHYFENLLYRGEDVYGGINKQSLTPDVQDAVEVCAQYVIYSLFGNRKAFEKFINVRKKGKWLDNETSYSDNIPQTCTCSVCGIRSRRPIGDFCKWCGADMRDDTDNQITVCPMCPDCPDNCPLGSDMRVVERKHGKWIMHIDDLFPVESTMECSECYHEQSLIIDDNFCPNCGADMREEAEDAVH